MSPFMKTLGFGAIAAASLPLTVLGFGPSIGTGAALALHAVVATSAYLASLASDLRTRVAVCLASATIAALAWAIAGSLASLMVLLGLMVAAVRSGWLFEQSTLRALGIEAVVVTLALGTAGFLYGPGLVSAALAAWGWFVAQSFYFLLAGFRPRAARPGGDAFEEAASQLERLLGGTP